MGKILSAFIDVPGRGGDRCCSVGVARDCEPAQWEYRALLYLFHSIYICINQLETSHLVNLSYLDTRIIFKISTQPLIPPEIFPALQHI